MSRDGHDKRSKTDGIVHFCDQLLTEICPTCCKRLKMATLTHANRDLSLMNIVD
jgi:hypothetical protein